MHRKRVLRCHSANQFLLAASNGWWAYCLIYFRELGFSSEDLGYMSAAGTIFAMAALPIAGMISDRIRSPRMVMAAALALSVPALLLFPVLEHTVGAVLAPFLVFSASVIMVLQVCNFLLDSWAGEELDQLGLNYGTVRRFGSTGYVCACVLASIFIGKVLPNVSSTFLMAATLLGMLLVVLIAGKRPSVAKEKKEKPVSTGTVLKLVFRNGYFWIYILFAIGYGLFLSVKGLGMSYIMDYVGTSRSNVGLEGMVRAGTEVVTMLVLGGLMSRGKKLPPYWVLLTLSGVLLATENFLYVFASDLGGILFASLFSGMGGGIYFCVATNFVFQMVDPHAASTAQSILGLVINAMTSLGNAVGGVIIANAGVIALTNLTAVIILTLSLLFGLGSFLGCCVLKKPYQNAHKTVLN